MGKLFIGSKMNKIFWLLVLVSAFATGQNPVVNTLNFEGSAAPTSRTGRLYYNSTLNTLFLWNGSAWLDLGASASGGVADGDKGDITVTSSGATWTIDDGVVTGAKIANETITAFDIQNNSISVTDLSSTSSKEAGEYLSYSGSSLDFKDIEASEIGVADAGGNFTATDVEGVLTELAGQGGLTATQTDQLEGLYGSWYEVMTGDEDGTQDPFLDLNGERRQRVGYVQASQALTVTLDNTHELGRKYMYFVSSATSSITFQASSGVSIIFEGQGDSQTGDQILVDALGSHVYFTRIANNQYVLASEGTISSQDFTPPTITSATVENNNPNEVVVVFSEPVNRLSQPTYPRLSGDIVENYVSHTGQGTNTLTFTYTTAFTSGDVVNFDYISSTFEDLSGNLLVAGSTAITNNVGASNLYAEASNANASNTGGTGSFVSDQGGGFAAVTEDSFPAIAITPDQSEANDAAGLPLEGAAVSTWSGGQITSFTANATYDVVFDYKHVDGTFVSVWTGSALLPLGNMNAAASFTEYTFSFTVPSGGFTSGATLAWRADDPQGVATLYIKNLRITQQ